MTDLTFYDFANEDLKFLEQAIGGEEKKFTHSMAPYIQGIVEKVLKHVVVSFVVPAKIPSDILHTHSLRRLYFYLLDVLPNYKIDRIDINMLDGFYIDARYPGDSAYIVTKGAVEDAYEALLRIKKYTDRFVKQNSK